MKGSLLFSTGMRDPIARVFSYLDSQSVRSFRHSCRTSIVWFEHTLFLEVEISESLILWRPASGFDVEGAGTYIEANFPLAQDHSGSRRTIPDSRGKVVVASIQLGYADEESGIAFELDNFTIPLTLKKKNSFSQNAAPTVKHTGGKRKTDGVKLHLGYPPYRFLSAPSPFSDNDPKTSKLFSPTKCVTSSSNSNSSCRWVQFPCDQISAFVEATRISELYLQDGLHSLEGDFQHQGFSSRFPENFLRSQLGRTSPIERVVLQDMKKLRLIGGGFLQNCQNLRSLTIRELPSLHTIGSDFLSFSSVGSISLKGDLPMLSNIGAFFLANNQHIQRVELHDLPALKQIDFGFLAEAPAIKKVSFKNLPQLTSIGHRSLLFCATDKLGGLIGDTNQPRLLDLELTDLPSFEGFSYQTSLESPYRGKGLGLRLIDLTVRNIKQLGDKSFLTYELFPSCRKVLLEGISEMTEIQGLSNLSKLEHLTIQHLPKLRRFQRDFLVPSREYDMLKSLIIRDIPSLTEAPTGIESSYHHPNLDNFVLERISIPLFNDLVLAAGRGPTETDRVPEVSNQKRGQGKKPPSEKGISKKKSPPLSLTRDGKKKKKTSVPLTTDRTTSSIRDSSHHKKSCPAASSQENATSISKSKLALPTSTRSMTEGTLGSKPNSDRTKEIQSEIKMREKKKKKTRLEPPQSTTNGVPEKKVSSSQRKVGSCSNAETTSSKIVAGVVFTIVVSAFVFLISLL